jgi:prolyl oligopeptidase
VSEPDYPPAPREPLVEWLPPQAPTYEVADPYRWLEDASSPETTRWLSAQDELVRSHVDHLPGRGRLRDRLTELVQAGMVSPPVWRGNRSFFVRRDPGAEHPVLVSTDDTGAERVLVDPGALDPTGVTTLDGWAPSKEGTLLAYQLSEGGTEESVLRVMDVRTGEVVDGPIDRVRYSPVAWVPGGQEFYYVRRLDPTLVPAGEEAYHRRVWRHRVGADAASDVCVFGEGREPTSYYGVGVSWDGRWLLVSAAVGTAPRNDLWIGELTAPAGSESEDVPDVPALVAVQEGVDAQTAGHVGRDGRLYLFTDRDAPRGRLAVTDPHNPSYPRWTDVVAEDAEAVLDDYAILDGPELTEPVLLTGWTRHALSEVRVHELATGRVRAEVPLPGLGSGTGLLARPEGGHEAWFGYTDHVTPSSVYRYDARTGETTLWASAPGRVAVPAIHAHQEVAISRDGTPVRLLVLAGQQDPTAPAPTILYGYGGFGVPMTPAYSASALAWVEAGGVYVVANIRGGSEEGEQWHRAGMREHKQNVFDDFHAVAEHLVARGWTTPASLSCSGGSNGGLLVGAALTQRPDLWAAVVCSAPLLDMVRYERFGLGATWREEYGSADDPVELGWLLSYSPYHHVREGTPYPATLFTVFDSDTRVDPLHARKMCAALQWATSLPRAQAPILLRRESDVGHGARAVSRSVELTVDMLAFQAHHTGLQL